MGILSCLETVSTSPLHPAEIVHQLEKGMLPLANNSWQDNYQINPAQPFRGTVKNNSFALSRVSVSRVRSSKPLTITGNIYAAAGCVGSVIRLRYYQASMLWVIVGLSAMAASLGTAAVLQDLRVVGRANPWCLVYLVLPICGLVAQYIQVRKEKDVSFPLLAKLLMLKATIA